MGKNKVVLFLIQIHFDYRSFFAIIFFHKKNIITSKWAILGTAKLLRMNSHMIKDGSSIIRMKKKKSLIYANFFLLHKKYSQHAVFNHFKILGANESKANQ